MSGHYVYLDEDFDDVLESVKRELRIEGGNHVDSGDSGDFGIDEPRRVLPRRRNGNRVDGVWALLAGAWVCGELAPQSTAKRYYQEVRTE